MGPIGLATMAAFVIVHSNGGLYNGGFLEKKIGLALLSAGVN